MTIMNTTRRYTVSPLMKGMVIGGIAFFSLFALAALLVVWSSDKPMHEAPRLMLPFLGFCYFVKLFVGYYTRMYDCVEVTDQALIYEPAKGVSITLPWEQVVSLVPHGWNRRYDVLDAQDNCRMQISYDLDNFAELDAALRKHIRKSAVSGATTWFTKTAGGQTFVMLGAGILIVAILGLWFQGPNAASLFCMVGSVVGIPYGLYYRIEKVTVMESGLIIHYWKRQISIPYVTIKKLSLQEDYIPGAWRTICIERIGHGPMKIEWVADEAMAFCQTMESAWKSAIPTP